MVKGNNYIWENFYKRNSFLYLAAYAIDFTVSIQYISYNFLMIISLFKIEQSKRVQPSADISTAVDIRWLRFIGISINWDHLFRTK